MKISKILTGALFMLSSSVFSQNYWQQRADYEIQVDLDTNTHRMNGFETIMYVNNSPDSLHKVYFHLYYNAFQPGSMMDVRSRNISDPDRRVKDRISKLNADEIGYQNVKSFRYNGEEVDFKVEGTILSVELPKAIEPEGLASFDLEFEAQVPVQIRRTGRNNKEGIDYTMTQWYPKLAEYDRDGWHANEYVGREFYGVWGNFDVTIMIDTGYVLAGTGVVMNPNEVGHGYGTKVNNDMGMDQNIWHFVAHNVHDFAWAADPDYNHDIKKVDDSLQLHFFYQGDTLSSQWKNIQSKVVDVFKITNSTFGRYPYSDFSVIQGGDGGMEYPMCTMVLGHGSEKGMVGLIAHESIHNWYYGVLGSNEYRYPWMDEGMTTYAEEIAMHHVYNEKPEEFLLGSYNRYSKLISYEGLEEPMSTPGDLFNHNYAYSVSSYSKGALTLNMLRYIMGDEAFYNGMLTYFDTWKFKHPRPDDFLRIMELESNLELDWFFEHWVNTLHHIDYSVEIEKEKGKGIIQINNQGDFPMPMEVEVTLSNGDKINYYIPLRQMRGVKPTEATTLKPWAWVDPNYEIVTDVEYDEIMSVTIDPVNMLPDVDRSNNIYPQLEETNKSKEKKKKK